MKNDSRFQGFSQGIGRWLGTAEVYDGAGRFLGNATDQRHVQPQAQQPDDEKRIRIDLSFVGPFKFAGHYFIEDHTTYRLYQGPANTGFAETLASNLIDANAYWPITGLSQRFFLMVLPGGDRQMSLALMARGEQLLYVVVGEYQRLGEAGIPGIPGLVNGTSYDLGNDPACGRGCILLHRNGRWAGEMSTLDGDLNPLESTHYVETLRPVERGLQAEISGAAFAPDPARLSLTTDGWLAWTPPGAVVGSYSLSGGRALSGHFHHLDLGLRVWRREVVSHDGDLKAALHIWHRGGQRIGVQFGVLSFDPD